MITQRLVVAAVFAFVLAWGALVARVLLNPSPPETDAAGERATRHLSAEEIARHDRPEDCWIVVRGEVYDVTDYIDAHPAPRRTITDHCGEESTRAFETKEESGPHSARAWAQLDDYRIGETIDPSR